MIIEIEVGVDSKLSFNGKEISLNGIEWYAWDKKGSLVVMGSMSGGIKPRAYEGSAQQCEALTKALDAYMEVIL